MSETITLIACGIFQEEAEHVLKKAGLDEVKIDWLEVGLHDNIDLLESILDETLKRHREEPEAGPLGIMYGWACLPWMKDFAKERHVPVLPVKNCLAALVGDAELRELEQNNTMVASPGWVRKMWLGRSGTTMGWKADDFRLQFGRYDLILVLDPGLNPLSDEEIITCFDLVQVPLETRPCDLGHFRGLLLDFIETVRQSHQAVNSLF